MTVFLLAGANLAAPPACVTFNPFELFGILPALTFLNLLVIAAAVIQIFLPPKPILSSKATLITIVALLVLTVMNVQILYSASAAVLRTVPIPTGSAAPLIAAHCQLPDDGPILVSRLPETTK
ncbi:hypothetical protein [Planctomicrobium sp. SH664]|uniref:hypothetical protein n=1 Tax=Planctomicrobium sp. SH664 TaxID=3448125 RepID=UPI003F5C15B7